MRSGSLNRARVVVLSIVAIGSAWTVWQVAASTSDRQQALAAEPSAAGAAERVAWTSRRVSGSPEPPPPYQLERAFAKLNFSSPVDIAFEPGTNRIFVVELAGKIYSFPNDPSCAQPD